MTAQERISKEKFLQVAQIARLEVGERELEVLEKEANEILGYLGKVREIQEKGEELVFMSSAKNPLRKDVAKNCGNEKEITEEFTQVEGGFLVSPKNL